MCIGILKIRLAKDTFFFLIYQRSRIFFYNYYCYYYLNLLQFFSLRFFRVWKLAAIIVLYYCTIFEKYFYL